MCDIASERATFALHVSKERIFFSTFLASPIAVFLFGVRQDQDSSALSFPRSFSLLPCRLVPGHSPFEKGEFLSSSLSAVSDAAAMTLVAFRRTAPPADRPRPPGNRAECGFCFWESPLGRARPLLYSGVIHE